ncbi:LrgB-like family-domain-containing protein [Lipomyces japonicus]|uniref:LrgB-like family-domain-containing protein n=1 Tax=Lipomyces japonicus TaxID=56871 RepID=UPI0034CDD34E
MLLLFAFLLALRSTIGARRTALVTQVIDVPLGWALRWINTFFTPSFVLLPLSPGVGGAEVGKIAAVFIIGYVIMVAITAYLVLGLQKLFNVSKRALIERAEELPPSDEPRGSSSIELEDLTRISSSLQPASSADKSVADSILLQRPETAFDPANPPPLGRTLTRPELDFNRQVDDDLTSMSDLTTSPTRMSRTSTAASQMVRQYGGAELSRQQSIDTVQAVLTGDAQRAQPSNISPINSQVFGLASDSVANSSKNKSPRLPAKRFLIGVPSPRAEKFALNITQYWDTFLYTFTFFTVGLPVYFVTGYTLIAHGTFTTLMLFIGLRLPANWRRFVHPIFTCSGLTILGIFVLAAARHRTSLDSGLHAYSTGRTYINLFGVPEYKNVLPGAGDMLKTLLDVSIVSLALPMYRYRDDLFKHFTVIMIPNILVGFITFFAYPPICYAIGISAERSLAFVGRSVTLALALPVVNALGGSQSLVAVTAILSGIVGVIIGGYLLKWLRIREDDYLTRGITLGINSSAVATAHLLTIDPRASALSSLSFVVFGMTLIVLSAIDPVVHVIRNMVGLS